MPTIQYTTLQTALSVYDLNLLTIYLLYYGLVNNIVCATFCYESEMLDEHNASGSLFESPLTPPPPIIPNYKRFLSIHIL